MNLKSQLAPKGLEFRPGDMVISGKYCCFLTVISYPKMINEGYLANLTQYSGIKVIIKHIPIDFSVLSKMLNKEIADMKMKYQNEHDRTIQERTSSRWMPCLARHQTSEKRRNVTDRL